MVNGDEIHSVEFSLLLSKVQYFAECITSRFFVRNDRKTSEEQNKNYGMLPIDLRCHLNSVSISKTAEKKQTRKKKNFGCPFCDSLFDLEVLKVRYNVILTTATAMRRKTGAIRRALDKEIK